MRKHPGFFSVNSHRLPGNPEGTAWGLINRRPGVPQPGWLCAFPVASRLVPTRPLAGILGAGLASPIHRPHEDGVRRMPRGTTG